METGTIKLSVKPYIDRAKLSDITLTSEEIGRYLKAALRSSCKLLRDYARTHHNYKDVTGKLTSGIRYNVYSGTRSKDMETWYGSVGYIYDDARPDYAKWQLYGTGLYGAYGKEIVPKPASFFRYRGIHGDYRDKWITVSSNPKNGQGYIRGIQGEDYIRNAYIKNKVKIDNIFEDKLQLLIRTKMKQLN